jgi:hypothetical protein
MAVKNKNAVYKSKTNAELSSMADTWKNLPHRWERLIERVNALAVSMQETDIADLWSNADPLSSLTDSDGTRTSLMNFDDDTFISMIKLLNVCILFAESVYRYASSSTDWVVSLNLIRTHGTNTGSYTYKALEATAAKIKDEIGKFVKTHAQLGAIYGQITPKLDVYISNSIKFIISKTLDGTPVDFITWRRALLSIGQRIRSDFQLKRITISLIPRHMIYIWRPKFHVESEEVTDTALNPIDQPQPQDDTQQQQPMLLPPQPYGFPPPVPVFAPAQGYAQPPQYGVPVPYAAQPAAYGTMQSQPQGYAAAAPVPYVDPGALQQQSVPAAPQNIHDVI